MPFEKFGELCECWNGLTNGEQVNGDIDISKIIEITTDIWLHT